MRGSKSTNVTAVLCLALLPLGCQWWPSGSFRAERIPPGKGWHCWTGRCDRICQGRPGPPDVSGVSPEPVCSRPTSAFCTTFALHGAPHWECFEDRASCEAKQRHYATEAKAWRDYSAVSVCTEVP